MPNPLNIPSRTIYCKDNLDILEGINSDCVDLIYLDPPFNKKKTFTAPIGSAAEGAEFADIFREEDLKDEWVQSISGETESLYEYLNGIKASSSSYTYCYLVYMAVRLLECHRILKDTGSIYLHCDPTMSHYLKVLLDCIFDEENFRNEIIWCYKSGGASSKRFSKKHDVIFCYAKHKSQAVFNPQQEKSYNRGLKPYGFKGIAEYQDDTGWYTLVNMKDVWNIDMVGRTSKERTGYPTQKPLALLKRIIEASSNPGDMVLDPFCGCATTCIAAESLQRGWVGIDVSHRAYELVKQRLEKEVPSQTLEEPNYSTVPPKRTTAKSVAESGYIYVISNPAFPGVYKVGIAKDVQRRLNSFQTSDPNRAYKIEYQLHSPNYKAIERSVHSHFDDVNGEWVTAKLEDIITHIKQTSQAANVAQDPTQV